MASHQQHLTSPQNQEEQPTLAPRHRHQRREEPSQMDIDGDQPPQFLPTSNTFPAPSAPAQQPAFARSNTHDSTPAAETDMAGLGPRHPYQAMSEPEATPAHYHPRNPPIPPPPPLPSGTGAPDASHPRSNQSPLTYDTTPLPPMPPDQTRRNVETSSIFSTSSRGSGTSQSRESSHLRGSVISGHVRPPGSGRLREWSDRPSSRSSQSQHSSSLDSELVALRTQSAELSARLTAAEQARDDAEAEVTRLHVRLHEKELRPFDRNDPEYAQCDTWNMTEWSNANPGAKTDKSNRTYLARYPGEEIDDIELEVVNSSVVATMIGWPKDVLKATSLRGVEYKYQVPIIHLMETLHPSFRYFDYGHWKAHLYFKHNWSNWRGQVIARHEAMEQAEHAQPSTTAVKRPSASDSTSSLNKRMKASNLGPYLGSSESFGSFEASSSSSSLVQSQSAAPSHQAIHPPSAAQSTSGVRIPLTGSLGDPFVSQAPHGIPPLNPNLARSTSAAPPMPPARTQPQSGSSDPVIDPVLVGISGSHVLGGVGSDFVATTPAPDKDFFEWTKTELDPQPADLDGQPVWKASRQSSRKNLAGANYVEHYHHRNHHEPSQKHVDHIWSRVTKTPARGAAWNALFESLKTEKRLPPSTQQASSSSSSSARQAPSSSHQAPSSSHQAPSSSARQAPSSSHQAPSSSHQAPSSSHQAPPSSAH